MLQKQPAFWIMFTCVFVEMSELKTNIYLHLCKSVLCHINTVLYYVLHMRMYIFIRMKACVRELMNKR